MLLLLFSAHVLNSVYKQNEKRTNLSNQSVEEKGVECLFYKYVKELASELRAGVERDRDFIYTMFGASPFHWIFRLLLFSILNFNSHRKSEPKTCSMVWIYCIPIAVP